MFFREDLESRRGEDGGPYCSMKGLTGSLAQSRENPLLWTGDDLETARVIANELYGGEDRPLDPSSVSRMDFENAGAVGYLAKLLFLIIKWPIACN